MLNAEKLNRVVDRFDAIQQELASGSVEGDDFVALSKEYADLSSVAEKIQLLRDTQAEVNGLDELLADPDSDAEMTEMAELEKADLTEQLQKVEREVEVLLLPKDAADEKNAILEVRAGTGGDEAAIFAGDLFRMYQRYSESIGWKFEPAEVTEGDHGGYKEAVANISGKGVFARLKFESGVHRVQRVPETESQGRIHTSAATVAVLPEAEEVDIEIKQEDIRIHTMRASGAGGQHVNTTDSAVRLTHIPTGIVVVRSEKSQHQNRAQVMKELRARLYEMEREKADSARAEDRKGQVGSGDRSERIRTYNYPQGRVTDHRINLTLYKLPQIMAGDGLDEIVQALITEHQATLLAADEGIV